MKLKILDLFSGLGGFSLGLERTGQFKTVAFCEIDKFCTLILQKHWKGVKIYNDVKEITKEKFITDGIQLPDIITGGFPCQPFSVAGKQKGTSDDRHLWPEMFRIIQEFTPRWVVGENVKGITNIQDGMVFETVCTDLEGAGYEVRTFNIPACSVGAPHRRERMWIVAHRKESMVNPDDIRLEQHNTAEEETSWWRTSTTFEPTSDVVNTISNDEGRKISRSYEEERRIQEEYREDNSTSRKSSGTSSVRQTNDGHEGETTMADTNLNREKWNQSEDRNGSRTQQGSEDVANTKSSIGYDHEAVAGNGEFKTQEVFGDGSSLRTTQGESFSEDVADGDQQIIQATTTSGNDKENEKKSPYEHDRGRSPVSRGKIMEGNWDVEPDVGRVAHGIPGRVYRLKGLGNSIVPQIAQEIGNAIIKAESEE